MRNIAEMADAIEKDAQTETSTASVAEEIKQIAVKMLEVYEKLAATAPAPVETPEDEPEETPEEETPEEETPEEETPEEEE